LASRPDLIHNILPNNYLAERGMFALQMRLGHVSDEELASVKNKKANLLTDLGAY
jgi:hypothetical protein